MLPGASPRGASVSPAGPPPRPLEAGRADAAPAPVSGRSPRGTRRDAARRGGAAVAPDLVQWSPDQGKAKQAGQGSRQQSSPGSGAGSAPVGRSAVGDGVAGRTRISPVSAPREATMAAATCCGSRRTVDTAERLVLPPRRAHWCGSTGRLGAVHRQEAIATWAVAFGGVLGLPLIVSCAYALLLWLEAEGTDAAARVQLPWIQLSAVSAIGVTFVIAAARAWLRWPARSSSAFRMQLMAAMFCVALTAGHFYGTRNAALSVSGEPEQPTPAGAAGSTQCVALDIADQVGGFCDVSTRVVAVPVGFNGTVFADIDAHLRGLLQASHAAVLASSLLLGVQVPSDVVDLCVNDALLPWLCESALPTCSSSCSPMKPCRSWCTDIRVKCPFLVDELLPFVQPEGALDTILEPIVRQTASFGVFFRDLLLCDHGGQQDYDEACSAPEIFAAAGETATGPCYSLLSAASRNGSANAAAEVVNWGWTGAWTTIAPIFSTFSVVMLLFCGEFVPVPCLLQKQTRQLVSSSGASIDGRSSRASNSQSEDSPRSAIRSPGQSTLLNSSNTLSDIGSPLAYHKRGPMSAAHPEGVEAPSTEDAHPVRTIHAFGIQPQLSPASELRADMARRGTLAAVDESQPQAAEDVSPTVSAYTEAFRSTSPQGLPQKSPAVLMRRNGGFKGGERGRVHSASTRRRSRRESEPDAIGIRLLKPSVSHVLGYQNFVAAIVLGCSGVCLLRLGLVAEYTGDAGSAAAFDLVAVVSVAVAWTSLVDWRFIYAEGISVYRHGERRYLRMRAADTASFASRVRFRLLWLRARWRELFGLRGRYFKQRLLVTEVVEIIVQVVGLLDRLDAAENSEIVLVVSLIVINLTGGAVLHARDSTIGSAEVSLLFEVVCDVAFLVHLVVVVSSATVVITPTQVVGLLVPSLATLFSIRTLNRVVIMRLAASDAADAGVVKHLGATAIKTLRQFRVRTSNASAVAGQQSPSDALEQHLSFVSDDGEGVAPSSCQQLLSWCRKAYVFAVLILVMPILVATIVRLVVADATCAARVGPLWSGVTASSKSLLAGGFFSEPACLVDQTTYLDLRDTNLKDIREDILQFTALREIDARGNKNLLHVSAAVAKLPALERLRLDGTAAARHILWGSANLSEVPDILRSITEVELLDLSGNYISTVDDADVAALESLHTLILSNNELTALPDRLGTHKSLRVLLASNNFLSEVSQSLVPLIRRLDALDLSNNLLTELPSAFGSHVFDYLNVTGNDVTELRWDASDITHVPNAMFDLPLRALVLSANGLRDIPAEIVRLSQLEFLDISRNALTILPAGVKQLQNLRTLVAHTNYFNATAVSSVWDLPKLESADFACCALCAVPDPMWSSSTLQSLDISFNSLGSSSVSYVAAELVTSPLRSLNLQSTWVDDVPVVLLHSVVRITLQGVVLPVSVGHVDPAGVEALNLTCSVESDGTEESLQCGSVPENWPRSNLRSTCAFAYAPHAPQSC